MNKTPALDVSEKKVSTNSQRFELETVSGASDVDEFESKKNNTI